MTEADKKFVDNWEKIKSQGKIKYIVKHGVGFGIVIFVVNLLLNYWDKWGQLSNTDFFVQLAISIIVGGGIYGLFSWSLNDFIYRKKLKDN
jgi:small-conductance mechanosensitive channel